MKAIVLTYDRNHHIAQNMIKAYGVVWPTHPFEFLLPFQTETFTEPQEKLTFKRTDSALIATALQLLDETDDDEWVFWSIDDYFPLKIDTNWIHSLVARLDSIEFDNFCGVNICLNVRGTRYWRNRQLQDGRYIAIYDDRFVENLDYSQMWIHQFFRAGVLKRFFSHLTEPEDGAKELDYQLRSLKKPSSDRLLISSSDRSIFSESTVRGNYTLGFVESARKFGIALDSSRVGDVTERSKIVGRMGLGDKIEKWLR